MSQNSHVLGIDIGTTSIKVCIVKEVGNEILEATAANTEATVRDKCVPDSNQQSVSAIIAVFNRCLRQLSKHHLKHVNRIGICGQMHGIMFWNRNSWAYRRESIGVSAIELLTDNVSDLYTWQDLRCSAEFLSTLPKPQSHLDVYSGFGCATIFWMLKNQPQILNKYEYCGTIQDFVATILCDLPEPKMSVQNAASWGYFNCANTQWNLELLKSANFPVRLLPVVVESNAELGYLKEEFFGMRENVLVGVALGDLQCSAMATLENQNDAMLNISTSAQFAFICRRFDPMFVNREQRTKIDRVASTIEYYPYFGGRYLAVAASLNGGNALATFVGMLSTWLRDLDLAIDEEQLWNQLLKLSTAENHCDSLVNVKPTLLGERSDPKGTAAITNIRLDNLQLGSVFKAICNGIVENLRNMIPNEVLKKSNIVRVIANGSCLDRNPMLQNAISEQFRLPIVRNDGGDAAHGAAIAMFCKRRDSFF